MAFRRRRSFGRRRGRSFGRRRMGRRSLRQRVGFRFG